MLVKDTALWESIHSSPDLDVDVSIFGEFGGEIVFIDNIFGEIAWFEAHVFVSGHRGVEVEIFDVDNHELGSWGGYKTIEKELHG